MLLFLLFGVVSCFKTPAEQEETHPEAYLTEGDVVYEYVEGKGYYVKNLKRSLLTLTLPDTVDAFPVVGIRHEALADQTDLTTIRLPDPLEYVEPYAFYSCPKLTYHSYRSGNYLGNETNPYLVLVEVTDDAEIHPDTRILLDAFSGLSLSEIEIPESVRYIQYDAFENAEKGTCLPYRNGYYLGNRKNPYLVLVDSDDREKIRIHPKTEFILSAFGNRTNLKEIEIPAGVRQISDYAFHHCTSLKKAVFRGKPDYLGEYAFLNCSSLSSLVLPESVLSVPFACFARCEALEEIQWSSGLKRIEDYAFYDCSSLKNPHLSDGIRRIGFKAFSECDHLSLLSVGSARYLSSESNPYCCFIRAENTVDLVLDSRCRFVIGSVPSETENLALPDSLSYLENHLFDKADSLTKIFIPSDVLFIERDAFSVFHPMRIFFEGMPPSSSYLDDWKTMGMTCYVPDEEGRFVGI